MWSCLEERSSVNPVSLLHLHLSPFLLGLLRQSIPTVLTRCRACTHLLLGLLPVLQVVAFVKGTRTSPSCGFSYRVLTILNEIGADYEVGVPPSLLQLGLLCS